MNSKKAKTLRKIARAQTVGFPLVEYVRHRDGSQRHSAFTTRGVYRALVQRYRTILHVATRSHRRSESYAVSVPSDDSVAMADALRGTK